MRLSFNDFLTNCCRRLVDSVVGLIIYCRFTYRHELALWQQRRHLWLLLDKLAERASRTGAPQLVLSGAFMLVLFIAGEQITSYQP